MTEAIILFIFLNAVCKEMWTVNGTIQWVVVGEIKSFQQDSIRLEIWEGERFPRRFHNR